jgi:hypothetical protein
MFVYIINRPIKNLMNFYLDLEYPSESAPELC